MNIVHVVVSLDPAAGGPPIVAARLAAAQAQLGHAVSIVAYDRPAARQAIAELLATPAAALADSASSSTSGFTAPAANPASDSAASKSTPPRYDPLPPPNRLERLAAPLARRLLPQKLADADVLHLHGVWDPILAAAATAARRLNLPYVLAPHGMLDPWSLSQSRLKKRIALVLAYRRMLNGAALLHLLNEDESKLIDALHLQPPRRVIPNGISPQEIAHLPPAGTFRRDWPQLGGDPFVLFLGRLHFKKGLDILAHAFAMLAPWHPTLRLVIAGPDDGARAAALAQLSAAGLAGRALFTGPLFGPAKYAALVDAACFCLPSRQEGFSVAILEALASGTPVVISQACHFPEVARNGAGEVVPLEASAVAQAIGRVLGGGAQQRQAMGAAGRAMVQADYTWPRIACQTLDAYRQIIDSSAKPPA